MGNIQESARRSAEAAHSFVDATAKARGELPGVFLDGLNTLQKHGVGKSERHTPFVELNGDQLALSGRLSFSKAGIYPGFSELGIEAIFPTAGKAHTRLLTISGKFDDSPRIRRG